MLSKLSHTSSQFDWISPSVICMSVATGVSSGLYRLDKIRMPNIHRHLEKAGFLVFLRTTQERTRVRNRLGASARAPPHKVCVRRTFLFQVLGENFRSSQKKKIAIFSSLMKPLGTPIPAELRLLPMSTPIYPPLLHVMVCAASVQYTQSIM